MLVTGVFLGGRGGQAATPSASLEWTVPLTRTAGGEDQLVDAAIDAAGGAYLLESPNFGRGIVRLVSGTGVPGIVVPVEPGSGDNAACVAPDGAGGFVVGGSRPGTADDDVYVARYNASGQRLWETAFDKGGDEEARDIATDGAGNVLVLVMRTWPVMVGTVVKLSPAGAQTWSRTVTVAFVPGKISADAAGNSWVAGRAVAGIGLAGVTAAGSQSFAAWYPLSDFINGVEISANPATATVSLAGWDGWGNIALLTAAGGSGALTGSAWWDDAAWRTVTAIMSTGAGPDIYLVGSRSGASQDLYLARFSSALALSWEVPFDSGFPDYGSTGAVGVDAAGNPVMASTIHEYNSFECRMRADLFVTSRTPGSGPRWSRALDLPPGTALGGGGPVADGGLLTGASIGSGWDFPAALRYGPDGSVKWAVDYSPPGFCPLNLEPAFVSGGQLWLGMDGSTTTFFERQLRYVRYDPNGVITRQIIFSTTTSAYSGPAAEDAAGNLVIAGFQQGGATDDLLLLKYSAAGAQVWKRVHDLVDDDYPNAIVVDADGSSFVSEVDDRAAPATALLARFDSAGLPQWTKNFGGGVNDAQQATLVRSGSDLYLGGSESDSGTGLLHGYLHRLDGAGTLTWTRQVMEGEEIYLAPMAADPAGGVMMGGAIGNFSANFGGRMFAVNYDASGAVRWNYRDPAGGGYGFASGVTAQPPYVTGNIDEQGRAWKLRAGPDGAPALTILAAEGREMIAFPNPVPGDAFRVAVALKADAAELEVDVFNAGMRRVYHGLWKSVAVRQSVVTVDGAAAWAPGRYLVRVKARLIDGTDQSFAPVKLVVRR